MEKIGRLIIGSMPIGNWKDITIRLIEWLRDCNLLVVEHSEHVLPMLSEAGIEYNQNYIEYNDFDYNSNDIEKRSAAREKRQKSHNKIIEHLDNGENVLLISDEGSPMINDPGHELVISAYLRGHIIDVLPGPSTITTSYVHAKYRACL